MFQELKLIFQANAQIERYEVSNKFYSCTMEENSSVSEHILKMFGYNSHLIQLGVNLPDDSVIDRILQSLPPSYKSFVMNYNMQGMNKTIPELFAMLKAAEAEIKKEHQVLMVNKTTSFKKKGKGKKKVLGNVAEIQNFPTRHQDLSMEKPATSRRRVHLHTLVDR